MQKKKNFQKSGDKNRTYVHEKLDGTEREGLVVAHFGAMAEVEDASGQVFQAHLRKNAEPCITGDQVLWRLEKDNTGVVVSVLSRKSLLARPENSKKTKLIAANIDAIIIVTAPLPLFSERLIDRYIVAAEHLKIQPIILLNKVDLLDEESFAEIKECLSVYEKMGYLIIFSSIFQPNGLQQLEEILKGKTSVLVGVSGVGKSSIIAAFTGLTNIMIGDVSTIARLGKHTTTTTRFYHLPQGGSLIDSPGVREFSLWHLPPNEILQGFIDFHPFLGDCKFRNCQHQSEPGCALLQAVEENKINPDRWESYQAILRDLGK